MLNKCYSNSLLWKYFFFNILQLFCQLSDNLVNLFISDLQYTYQHCAVTGLEAQSTHKVGHKDTKKI